MKFRGRSVSKECAKQRQTGHNERKRKSIMRQKLDYLTSFSEWMAEEIK